MPNGYKKVPAIGKCFSILDLMAGSKDPVGISEIAKALDYNRSTVFNIVYTLLDLGILEKRDQTKFHFGTQLYILSRSAIRRSDLINTVHPYLEEINRRTRLMAILGIRSDLRAVILDKVNSSFEIQIVSEVGMRIPLIAGAGGKALLSQLPDEEIDFILDKEDLKRFTPHSCTDKGAYKALLLEAREKGIAVDMEEYIEGMRALAVPLNLKSRNLDAAVWVVGLKDHIKDEQIESYSELLKRAAKDIETRLELS